MGSLDGFIWGQHGAAQITTHMHSDTHTHTHSLLSVIQIDSPDVLD